MAEFPNRAIEGPCIRTGSKNTVHSLSLWQLPPQRKPTYLTLHVYSKSPHYEEPSLQNQSWKDIKELFAQTKTYEENEVKELERDVGFCPSLAAPRTTKKLLILKIWRNWSPRRPSDLRRNLRLLSPTDMFPPLTSRVWSSQCFSSRFFITQFSISLIQYLCFLINT